MKNLLALALAAFLTFASPALAQTAPTLHKVELTAAEDQTLRSLIDSTLKQMGVQAAKVLMPIIDKLDAAAQKAQVADKAAEDAAKAADEAAKIKAAVDAAKAPPPVLNAPLIVPNAADSLIPVTPPNGH